MSVKVGNPTMEAIMSTVREYDARVDTKKRVTLRGTEYRNYHVREYADGRIEMLPQELVEVSARTVEMMDRSIQNLNKGVAGEPLDLSRFRD
jgi:hypothetical protein